MSNRRVVITGMGAVTPIGDNVNEFWNSLINGKSGIGTLTKFDVSGYSSQIAAEVRDFSIEKFGLDARKVKRKDIFVLYALVAAKEAVEQSGFDVSNEDPFSCGVILGSGIGGLLTVETEHSKLLEKGPRKVSPFFIPGMIRRR